MIVFAKPPVPGRVKTRLAALLTEAEAARLYEAFLRDALDQYRHLGADLRLYFSAPSDAAYKAASVHEQRGEGLGARMQHAFRETLAAGYERVVIIGTDHPTLPLSFLEQAFAALEEESALCIGPSEDGGYYTLGMNDFYPQPFEDMTYSQPDVFAETWARLRQIPARLTVLPPWYDVDTPADLYRLVADLAELPVQAERTRDVLGGLRARYALDEAPPIS